MPTSVTGAASDSGKLLWRTARAIAGGSALLTALACFDGELRSGTVSTPIPLDTVPVVTLGGEGSLPLFGVVGATIVDGRIVVANGGSHKLHFYGMSGVLQRIAGGQGEGPGEFQNLRWIQELNGHLFAFDLDLFRLSEFSADGEFVGSVNIVPTEVFASAYPLGIFADGSILVAASATVAATFSRATTRRSTASLLRYDAEGHYLDSIGSWTGTEIYGEPWGSAGHYMTEVPAGRKSALAVDGFDYYVVEDNDHSIQVYDTAGLKVRELRPAFPVAPVAITAQMKAEFRDRRVAQIPSGVPIDIRDIVDRMPIPDTTPPYGWDGPHQLSMLRVSKGGTVWVLEYGGLVGTGPVWIVFAPDGSVRARITAEEHLDLLYAAGDVVLVRRWDDLDVETIEVRALP